MKLCILLSLVLLGIAFRRSGQTQTPAPDGKVSDARIGLLIPERARGTGGGCRFTGPLLRIPSRTAPGGGIVVRVSPPERQRYDSGAPIVIHQTPPGSGGIDGAPTCLSKAGFIDIAFLCPGYSSTVQPDGAQWRSGGSPTLDWKACVEALADVLAFATGRLRSTEGKRIQDYVPRITALTGNAGVIGYSVGGNIAVEAMAAYGDRFPALKWYVSWESPFAVSGWTLDEGSALGPNTAYNPATDEIDFSTLHYIADRPIRYFPTAVLPPNATELRGALALDDYTFQAEFRSDPTPKAYYSPRVTRAAQEHKLFGNEWPSHIATPAESERFSKAWQRELVADIAQAAKRFPELAVGVFESAQHHLCDAAGHGWAVAQIDAFLDGGARFVRLNPDARYLEWAMGRKPARLIQNPAGQRFTSATVNDAVELEDREGGPTDKAGLAAIAAELADRVSRDVWSPVLDRLLVELK